MTRSTRRLRLLLPVVLAVVALSIAAPSVAAAAPQYPTQSLGNLGADVRAIQWLLTARGYAVTVDGVFGEPTRTAVMALETAVGLPADGIIADATWARLIVPVGAGATGPAVKAAQYQLRAKRHLDVVVDGTYGADTIAAVKAFQRHARLTPSGHMNSATWRRLIAHFELPSFNKTSLCDYSVGNGKANWATSAAINQLEAAARIVASAGHGRVAVGDIGLQHGGDIAGHETHERGLDVDIRPMRKAEDQCRWGGSYRAKTYDRAATRALAKAIRQTAPGHVKLIYFNDPVLIREGLTRHHAGHDDHLHVRYCEKTHPFAKYDC
jgi:peptidoglycan hydrolase-like protein with peptidoglycan-binding domain